MILNVHGLCASTQVEFFYCALFHVLCFYPSRIVLCFLRPTYLKFLVQPSLRACHAIPHAHQNVLMSCCSRARAARYIGHL